MIKLYITNKLNALTIQRYMRKEDKTLKKLSSGYRINIAADDAAGLSISEKMRAQIRGLNQSEENVQDAISLIQTADGGLDEIHSILRRMRELAVQSANGTYTDSDRECINDEVSQLKEQIDNIAHNTEFNTIKLLDGSLDKPKVPVIEPEPEPVPPPEPEPVPPPIVRPEPVPTPETLPNISFTSVKNKYSDSDIGIKAERVDTVDFSAIKDGSIITIEGVNFEFDTDGNVKDDSLAVDISALSGTDYIAIANKFKDVFQTSSLYSGISAVPQSKYLELNTDSANPNDSKIIEISVTDALGDFIADGKTIDIKYSPTNLPAPLPTGKNIEFNTVINEPASYNTAATRYDVIDFSKIEDGSIISVQGVNFEFDTDKKIEDGSISIDISDISNDYEEMANRLGVAVSSYDFYNNTYEEDIFIMDAYLDNCSGNFMTIMYINVDESFVQSGDYMDIKYYPSNLTTTTSFISKQSDISNIIIDNNFAKSNNTSIINKSVNQVAVVNVNRNNDTISEENLSNNYGIAFQIGANTGISLRVTIEGATTKCLGVDDAIVTNIDDAGKTITSVDNAINKVSDSRAKLGAVQNRLEATFNNLSVAEENLTVAESRIRDCDYSKEVMSFFKQDVMTQIAETMLTQANEDSKNVMQLLN